MSPLKLLGATTLLIMAASSAEAHHSFYAVGFGGPVYAYPAYGYYAPAYYAPPPPVVYYQPPVAYPVMQPPPPPPPPVQRVQNGYCREYSSPVRINGYWQRSYGTACLQPDGQWRLVD